MEISKKYNNMIDQVKELQKEILTLESSMKLPFDLYYSFSSQLYDIVTTLKFRNMNGKKYVSNIQMCIDDLKMLIMIFENKIKNLEFEEKINATVK